MFRKPLKQTPTPHHAKSISLSLQPLWKSSKARIYFTCKQTQTWTACLQQPFVSFFSGSKKYLVISPHPPMSKQVRTYEFLVLFFNHIIKKKKRKNLKTCLGTFSKIFLKKKIFWTALKLVLWSFLKQKLIWEMLWYYNGTYQIKVQTLRPTNVCDISWLMIDF